MDPDECLRAALAAARTMQSDDGNPGSNEGSEADYMRYREYHDAADTLAANMQALDEWIRKGGFLPRVWTAAQHAANCKREGGVAYDPNTGIPEDA